MKKPEVIPTLRCLASKYSEMSDHEKAQNYIDRAERLASDLLPSQIHSESLYNKVCKVELLLRQKNLPQEKVALAIDAGKRALELSK